MVKDLSTPTTGCPCGAGQWVLGQPRTLKSCPAETCNTEIFGSSLSEDKGGMVIGLPAYGANSRRHISACWERARGH